MSRSRACVAAALGLMALALAGFPAAAQAAAALPGGASSLNEVHGKWTVTCRAGTAKDAPSVACTVLQQQLNRNTRRRVIAIFLNAEADGGVKGALVMPFGLALAKGVTFQIDDGAATPPLPFSTCMPGGCLVPIDWTDKAVKALRQGKSIKLVATRRNGQPMNFAIPLDGLSSALDRVLALMK